MGSTSQLVPSHKIYDDDSSTHSIIYIYAQHSALQFIHSNNTRISKIIKKKMGAHILFTAAAALLLLAGSVASTATPECDIFHVTGSVLCQECGEGWNEWVNGANPIQGNTYSLF